MTAAPKSREVVAITCLHLQRDVEVVRAQIEAAGFELRLPEVPGQELSGNELVEAMNGVSGVIAGDDKFSADVLDACSDLRAISKWGIGLDGIDLTYAAECDITVTNTPGMFGNEVAENALGYLIMLVRGLDIIDGGVRDGAWPKPVGRSLNSLHVGVVGLGDIGLSLVRKLVALGCNVTGFDPDSNAQANATNVGARIAELDDALGDLDVLVLTCPLVAATHHLMNHQRIAAMKPDGFLINVARGPVVDTAALADLMAEGHLAGAALDVFETEPLTHDDPIRSAGRIIFGSHNSSNTREACHRTHLASVENLLASLSSNR